jgi:apolipoprotein N-acyltransferase
MIPILDRLGRQRGWRTPLAAALAGVALTLAQPPFSLWPLLFGAWPALLALGLGATSPRGAAWVGWWAGAAFFLSGLSWIGEAFLVEAGKVWWYLPVMPVAIGALAAFLGLFWAAAFWLARRFARPGWRGAAVFAGAILAVETARGAVLTGFPWALQAYALVETPLIQAAALIGAPALSGLTVAIAASVGLRDRRAWALAAAAVALGWGWGAWRLAGDSAPADGPVIRIVQPDVAQADKWAPENARAIFDNLLELSASPVAGPSPALVVWPEVAVTFLFDSSAEAIAQAVAALPPGAYLAAGAVRAKGDGLARRYYNSLLFYGPDGARLAAYDKRRLAPFGEYVPYAWVLGRLGIGTLGEGLSGFTPGERAEPVNLPGLAPVAPLICYEIIFPRTVAEATQGAGWMLQVTNDAWFGESSGPYQHFAQTRVRAIEQGMSVARAANTGISAMIDPYGRVRQSLGLNVRGVLDSPLPAAIARTPYARTGDAPVFLLLVCAAIIALRQRVKFN